MLFRGPGSEGFEPNHLRSFKAFLPYARAAAMASRARLRLEADRRAAPFLSRGEPVLHIAHDGTIHQHSTDALAHLAPDVTMRDRRLVVAAPGCQRRIDKALMTAICDRRPGLVTIMDETRSLRLLVIPVLGQALDVFRATAALVVALDISRPIQVDESVLNLLVSAAGLTNREIEVARLVVSGHTPRKISDLLDISYETVRFHLKGTFAKLNVHSQSEMITLLNRLSTS